LKERMDGTSDGLVEEEPELEVPGKERGGEGGRGIILFFSNF